MPLSNHLIPSPVTRSRGNLAVNTAKPTPAAGLAARKVEVGNKGWLERTASKDTFTGAIARKALSTISKKDSIDFSTGRIRVLERDPERVVAMLNDQFATCSHSGTKQVNERNRLLRRPILDALVESQGGERFSVDDFEWSMKEVLRNQSGAVGGANLQGSFQFKYILSGRFAANELRDVISNPELPDENQTNKAREDLVVEVATYLARKMLSNVDKSDPTAMRKLQTALLEKVDSLEVPPHLKARCHATLSNALGLRAETHAQRTDQRIDLIQLSIEYNHLLRNGAGTGQAPATPEQLGARLRQLDRIRMEASAYPDRMGAGIAESARAQIKNTVAQWVAGAPYGALVADEKAALEKLIDENIDSGALAKACRQLLDPVASQKRPEFKGNGHAHPPISSDAHVHADVPPPPPETWATLPPPPKTV